MRGVPLNGDALLATPPDSFDSLADLVTYSNAPRPSNRHAPPHIPYLSAKGKEREKDQAKLLVCHDYKGGYCEKGDERGYTFNWWSYCDTFVYFSHRRVSMPPSAWIRTAHRHGTKILGTLIFEWEAGQSDILTLLLGDRKASVAQMGHEAFYSFDTDIADMLVDIAVERGFEGWLVNVEVPLGLEGRAPDGKRPGADLHVKSLVRWLEYLKREVGRRVPGGEVMWYDGTNADGEVRWQNNLTNLNEPFFAACDSLFLNYFWHPSYMSASALRADGMGKRRSDVYFGIDVFGRSQYGGGGFSTWRAIDAIVHSGVAEKSRPSLPQAEGSLSGVQTSVLSENSVSVALFAPGWTVEAEASGHTLNTRETWGRWWTDEYYLWCGGQSTSSVSLDEKRIEGIRKEERGLIRARELARSLGGGSGVSLAPFHYHAPLPSLPGSFRPITSYLSLPRPPPSPSSRFYTNFNIGSGNTFSIEGERVFDSRQGWTDVDFAFPAPTLVYSDPLMTSSPLYEEEAWCGATCIRLPPAALEGPRWLGPLDITVQESLVLEVSITWKALEHPAPIDLSIILESSSGELQVKDAFTSTLANGWEITSTKVQLDSHLHSLVAIGVRAHLNNPESSLLIGAISIVPVEDINLPQPLIPSLQLSPILHPSIPVSRSKLLWKTSYLLNPTYTALTTSVRHPSQTPPRTPLPWPTFLFFTIWWIPDDSMYPVNAVFLGATGGSEWEVDMQASGAFCVRGVEADGTLQKWDRAVSCLLGATFPEGPPPQ